MAQRIYQLLSAVLMLIVSQSTLAVMIGKNGLTYGLTSLRLVDQVNGEVVSSDPWALFALSLLIAVLSLFTLFLVFFQNFALQKRMAIFNTLLTIGFMLVFAAYYYYYKGMLEAIRTEMTWWSVAIPSVVVILQFMSLLAIRKKEADILKKATTFRLRE